MCFLKHDQFQKAYIICFETNEGRNLFMEEKLLPIGSVVKLKNGQKRLMITGFLQMEQDEKGQKNI